MTARDIIQSLLQAKLELQDEEIMEQFRFINDSHVVATLGTKGGAVCGPVLNYSIGDDDSVLIGNSSGSLSYQWDQPDIVGETLRVMCGDAIKTFIITRASKKERWLP